MKIQFSILRDFLYGSMSQNENMCLFVYTEFSVGKGGEPSRALERVVPPD